MIETPRIEEFIAAHPGLAEALGAATQPLSQAFPSAAFELRMWDDLETGKSQLWLEVLVPAWWTRQEAHQRLADFDRTWWADRAGEWQGIFGITLA